MSAQRSWLVSGS